MCVLIACVSCCTVDVLMPYDLLSLYWYSDHDTVLPYTLLRRTQLKHMKTRSDLCVSFSVHFGKLFCVFSALSIVTFSLLPLVTSLWPCSYRVSISFQFGLTMLFISSTCKCKLRIKQKKRREKKYITSKCWTDGCLMTVDSEYASHNDILQKMNDSFSYLR